MGRAGGTLDRKIVVVELTSSVPLGVGWRGRALEMGSEETSERSRRPRGLMAEMCGRLLGRRCEVRRRRCRRWGA